MPLSKRDPANLFDMLEASEKVQNFPSFPSWAWERFNQPS